MSVVPMNLLSYQFVPLCKCDPGYTGNAFVSRTRMTTSSPKTPEPVDPCIPSPCGSEYFGDPFVALIPVQEPVANVE